VSSADAAGFPKRHFRRLITLDSRSVPEGYRIPVGVRCDTNELVPLCLPFDTRAVENGFDAGR
jgi:hypothetical protein